MTMTIGYILYAVCVWTKHLLVYSLLFYVTLEQCMLSSLLDSLSSAHTKSYKHAHALTRNEMMCLCQLVGLIRCSVFPCVKLKLQFVSFSSFLFPFVISFENDVFLFTISTAINRNISNGHTINAECITHYTLFSYQNGIVVPVLVDFVNIQVPHWFTFNVSYCSV